MANPAFQTDEVGTRIVPLVPCALSVDEPSPNETLDAVMEGEATVRHLMDRPLPKQDTVALALEHIGNHGSSESIKRYLLERRVEKLEWELARTRTNYFRVTQAIAKALRTAGIAIEVPELLNHDTLPPAA